MKKILALFTALLMLTLAGCTAVDNSSDVKSAEDKNDKIIYNVERPTIKSIDPVMPLYVDISIYDEEDYSKVYLGKDFKFDFIYSGQSFVLPTTYKTIKNQGYDFCDIDEYNATSVVKAGENLEVLLQNQKGNIISALFYNAGYTSLKISECPIVKISVKENNLLNPNSLYSQFSINSITNHSVVTDVIDALGAPSHFETFNKGVYRFSYFLTEKDRREKIVVEVDINNDCVLGIEVAKYKKAR